MAFSPKISPPGRFCPSGMAQSRLATWAIGCTVTNGQWPTNRTFKETSHWPFVTASACLGGPEHRRYLWGPAAGASTLSCIWLQPSGPFFKGRSIRLAPDSAEVFYPRRGTPPSSDPPRPTLRRGRVCDGDGRSMGEDFDAGITFCLNAGQGRSCSPFEAAARRLRKRADGRAGSQEHRYLRAQQNGDRRRHFELLAHCRHAFHMVHWP
jgi:hypothetical protein